MSLFGATDKAVEEEIYILMEGRPRNRRRGRRRIYPDALFIILMVMKALLGKLNNGIGKAIQSGELKLPPPLKDLSQKGGQ